MGRQLRAARTDQAVRVFGDRSDPAADAEVVNAAGPDPVCLHRVVRLVLQPDFVIM